MSQYDQDVALLWADGSATGGYDYAAAAEAACRILDAPEFEAEGITQKLRLARRMVDLYTSSWNPAGVQIRTPLQRLYRSLIEADLLSISQAVELYDSLYFLYWYTTISVEEQRGFAGGVVEPFSAWVRRSQRRFPARRKRFGRRPRVAYLCQFATMGQGNALAPMAILAARALRDGDETEPFLYAWLYCDEAFAAEVARANVPLRRFPAADHEDRVEAIFAQMQADEIDIVITDMNSAIPAVLFERRCAATQIYCQWGMPFWPLKEIDSILMSWHAQPALFGFETYKTTQAVLPWDIAALAPPRDEAAIVAERARFPREQRLIGMYGRLAKASATYLEILADILAKAPSIGVVIGGTGDGNMIENFARKRGLSDRLHVVANFVDGHVWGRFIDIFLDTFPLHGGISAREMIAIGRPVVTMRSREMPNLVGERDPMLCADDAHAYSDITLKLLKRPDEYRAACDRALQICAQRSGLFDFRTSIHTAIGARNTVQGAMRRSARTIGLKLDRANLPNPTS